MFIYFIIGLIIISGISMIVCEVVTLIDWVLAEKKEAIIVAVEGNGGHGGVFRYYYDVYIDTHSPQRMTLKVRPLNPIKFLFPKRDIGKKVFVRYKSSKNTLVQDKTMIFFYLVSGFFLFFIGISILYLMKLSGF